MPQIRVCNWCEDREAEDNPINIYTNLVDGNGELYNADICDCCVNNTIRTCDECGCNLHEDDVFRSPRNDDHLCAICHNSRRRQHTSPCLNTYSPSDKDIVEILKLADEWIIFGNKELPSKTFVTHNGDWKMSEITISVGEIDNAIDLFGLINPESSERNFHWLVSEDMSKTFIEILDRIFADEAPELRNVAVENTNSQRLGISKKIRKDNYNKLIELLKELGTCAELQAITPSELRNQQRIISEIYSSIPQGEEQMPQVMPTRFSPHIEASLNPETYNEMMENLLSDLPSRVSSQIREFIPSPITATFRPVWTTLDDPEEGSSTS